MRDATQPRQGVRGDELAVWGTAPPATSAVKAHFGHTTTAAAIFPIGPEWAQLYEERPFSLFIVELPLRAACTRITIRATRSKAIQHVGRPMGMRERNLPLSSWVLIGVTALLAG